MGRRLKKKFDALQEQVKGEYPQTVQTAFNNLVRALCADPKWNKDHSCLFLEVNYVGTSEERFVEHRRMNLHDAGREQEVTSQLLTYDVRTQVLQVKG